VNPLWFLENIGRSQEVPRCNHHSEDCENPEERKSHLHAHEVSGPPSEQSVHLIELE
jgi:hypothetical protein